MSCNTYTNATICHTRFKYLSDGVHYNPGYFDANFLKAIVYPNFSEKKLSVRFDSRVKEGVLFYNNSTIKLDDLDKYDKVIYHKTVSGNRIYNIKDVNVFLLTKDNGFKTTNIEITRYMNIWGYKFIVKVVNCNT